MKRKLLSGHSETFAVDAFSSMLFNVYVAERLKRDTFDRWLEGDIPTRRNLDPARPYPRAPASPEDGPDSEVPSPSSRDDDEFPRKTYTAPLVGKGLRTPDADTESAAFERTVVALADLKDDTLTAVAKGSRRAARLPCGDLSIDPHDEGVLFTFALPRGSYATSLMREFTKDRADVGSLDGDGDGDDDQFEIPKKPVQPTQRGGQADSTFAATRAAAGKGRRLEKWLLAHTIGGQTDSRRDASDENEYGLRRLRSKLALNEDIRKRGSPLGGP